MKNTIQYLKGVKGISNQIAVVPRLSSKDIEGKIIGAFHRSATVDANRIHVTTMGSKVTLSGFVRSWAEKDDAEDAAWAALGVSSVQNNLKIESPAFAF